MEKSKNTKSPDSSDFFFTVETLLLGFVGRQARGIHRIRALFRISLGSAIHMHGQGAVHMCLTYVKVVSDAAENGGV